MKGRRGERAVSGAGIIRAASVKSQIGHGVRVLMCFHLRSVVGGYMFTILDCSPVVSVNRRPFALILSQEIDKYI